MDDQATSQLDATARTTTAVNKHAVDPRLEYESRLHNRQSAVARYMVLDNRLAAARGCTFLAVVALVVAVFNAKLAGAWLIAPMGLFSVLVVIHARVSSQMASARQAIAYYERALARLDDRWSGVGPTGERYADPAHMYSSDLDVFGNGSLFQLLSSARTRLGEDTLAAWLSQPSNAATIRQRQAAVDELRSHIDLREKLALLDAEVHDDLDQNQLREWSQQPAEPVGRSTRIVAFLFAAGFLLTLFGWLFLGMGLSPVIIVLMAEILYLFSFRATLMSTHKTVAEAGSGLAILSQVLELIEQERFETDHLSGIRATLDTDGLPPSAQIARLQNLIQYLNNSLQNQFFAPLALVVCLPIHLIHAIETWKARVGPSIPKWLQAVGEIEALSSLGGYAFEHPVDPFPEIVESGPCFDGEALGHPLLPNDQCVRNDLAFGADLQLIMISGSNMSGKSTLLRTVGTNVVLALAGAPVRARKLRTSPFVVGTAMRVQDSLQAGASLFYTAISRLKSVVELTKQPVPLLFLLDEILQGTNSHDRRVGAEGIIRRLVQQHAAGLVTTHDLALTEIVPSFGDKAVNRHFEDQLVDGKMTFDYQIRSGIVEKSNALELMRMIGLDVDDDGESSDA